MKSISSFNWIAVAVVVPWSSSEAVKCARPVFPFGSSELPAPTSSRMLTTGCSWCETATMRRPLGSCCIRYGGEIGGRGGGGGGGGGPWRGGCFCGRQAREQKAQGTKRQRIRGVETPSPWVAPPLVA